MLNLEPLPVRCTGDVSRPHAHSSRFPDDAVSLFFASVHAAGSPPRPGDPSFAELAEAFLGELKKSGVWWCEVATAVDEADPNSPYPPTPEWALDRFATLGIERISIRSKASVEDMAAFATMLADASGGADAAEELAAGERPAIEVEVREDPDGSARIRRSLDQVLEVGTDVLQQSLHRLGTGEEVHFDDLQQVFQQAERAIAVRQDWSEVEIAADSMARGGPAPQIEEGYDPELSIRKLAAEMKALAREAHLEGGAELLTLEADAEELSILLQFYLTDASAFDPPPLPNRLEVRLREGMSEATRSVFWGAIRELMEAGHSAIVDKLIPVFARSHRFSGQIVEQLAWVANGTGLVGLEALWPHAVNEILIARRDKGQVREASGLMNLVASLPQERLEPTIVRLCELEAFAGRLLASDAFNARQWRMYPIFAELLDTPYADFVGPVILRGFRAGPPNWPGAIVLQGMREFEPSHIPLLQGFLAEDPTHYERLADDAATVAIKLLNELDPTDRKDAWVAATIHWLGHSRHQPAAELLREIHSSRKAPFMPAWPSPCRAAARDALRTLTMEKP